MPIPTVADANKKQITRADIMDMTEFAEIRRSARKSLVETKRHRRLPIGPDATFYFECYETMWWQVHEMLHIERGGEEQIADELEAYNPLIPNGRELVATIMFEIDDPDRRKSFLSKLGGVEDTVFLQFNGHEVIGTPEQDVDRTTADGKASSVQFVHFALTPEQIALFRAPATQIVVGFKHSAYAHMAVMPEAVREALSRDFD